jgi:hypothetical protein
MMSKSELNVSLLGMLEATEIEMPLQRSYSKLKNEDSTSNFIPSSSKVMPI